MTPEQRAIIKEQNAVLRQSELDVAMVQSRLERQIKDLQNAAEREKSEINRRVLRRVQELGEEYKRLGSATPAPGPEGEEPK